MKVRYTKRAQGDLDAILTYLNRRSPSGSANVAYRIAATVDHLSRHPRSGRETTRKGLLESFTF
jgi:plasmid stabilization system protein ParE